MFHTINYGKLSNLPFDTLRKIGFELLNKSRHFAGPGNGMRKSGAFNVNTDTRIWCEYCRIFVYNNRINREKHDSSPQHQANFKKKVETLRREDEQQKKILSSQSTSTASANKSFYQASTTAGVSNSSAASNSPGTLLNFNGSSKSAEKKPILGLSTNSAVIKKESEKPVDGNTLSQYSKVKKPLDIKSAASELKRKMKEDEKSLVEKSLQVEPVHEDADADVLTLFKKKKSK